MLFEEEIGESKVEVGEEEEDMLFVRVNWNDEFFVVGLEFRELNVMSDIFYKFVGEEVLE